MSIKSFPRLQTFITRKLHGIQTYILPLLKLVSKILCHVFIAMLQLYVCIPRNFLVINVCNQGNTLCSPCSGITSRDINNLKKCFEVRIIYIHPKTQTPQHSKYLPVHWFPIPAETAVLYLYVLRLRLFVLQKRVVLTHCGRVTQICVFNTVKLGTSASSR